MKDYTKQKEMEEIEFVQPKISQVKKVEHGCI